MAWYADIPEVTRYLKSNDDWNKAGPYIIGVLTLFALSFAVVFCISYLLLRSRRNEMSCSQENGSVNDEAIRRPRSVSASVSGFTTPPLPRDQESFYGSNPATASCSLSSIASRLPRVSEPETAPEGLQNNEGDNAIFFTPVSSMARERVGNETE